MFMDVVCLWCGMFFSSRRRHTRWNCDWSQTCALPILGATNMKGGLAAFTMAAEAIKKAGVRLRGDLVVAGVIGEIIMAPVDEYKEAKLRGYTRGTHYLVTHGFSADMAVVAGGTPPGAGVGGCVGARGE